MTIIFLSLKFGMALTLKLLLGGVSPKKMLADWNDLFSRISNVNLEDKEDAIRWNYEAKGVYTVKSFYNIVNFRGIRPGNLPVIWNINVPLRIQIFSGSWPKTNY